MSNYPPGSMKGSRIDEKDIPRHVTCNADIEPEHEDAPDTCPYNGTVDVRIDDWGYGTWECPRCGAEHDYEEERP